MYPRIYYLKVFTPRFSNLSNEAGNLVILFFSKLRYLSDESDSIDSGKVVKELALKNKYLRDDKEPIVFGSSFKLLLPKYKYFKD